MGTFSLDHLSPDEFEELCYDLLCDLGFKNINWRKGTGRASSPADSGRDIEAERERVDEVDQSVSIERWFIECKHYKRGIPAKDLQNALAWATSERPDVLLIVASNFLSNSAKDHLRSYKTKNAPSFRIRTWERPTLEKLVASRSLLRRKYEISGEYGFLSIMHPAHCAYIKKMQFNTIGRLFDILDGLDPDKRDPVLSWAYTPIIKPRYRKSVTGHETLRELQIDEVSYEAFKRACLEVVSKGTMPEHLLVFLIVNLVLYGQLGISDTTAVDEFVADKRDLLLFMEGKHPASQSYPVAPAPERALELVRNAIANAESNTANNYSLYEWFCENVLGALLEQSILAETEFFPPEWPRFSPEE